MAKLKTFEDYIASLDSAEEIEKDVMDMGEPEELGSGEEVITKDQPEAEAPEEVTESEDNEDEDKVETQIADLDDEDEEESKDKEESDDEEESKDKDDEDESEDDEDKEESEEAEAQKTVEEMIKEVYERVKSEAKVWEDDMHDTHTIESYLKENAALIAMMGAKTLKESRKDITQEQYEAACNGLKEAYAKKIDEMMEAWGSEGEEA